MNAPQASPAILAAGISGCARLHEKLGDSEAARAVDRCLKRVERSVEAAGGRFLRAGGGEAIAVFDSAAVAVSAAIEMQLRIADLPPVSGVKMAVRAGISCAAADEEGLVREAAHLAGAAKSGQTLALGKMREALPAAMTALLADAGVALPGESGEDRAVVKVLSEMPVTAASARLDAAHADGLRLVYGGDTITFDESRPSIHMGRDGACDLVVKNPRASRRHATIRRQENCFVLIDQSTNGTYVTLDGQSEQFVRHGECELRGCGLIAFASSASSSDADCARFECP
ncbi:MAG: FHA domain-containing protein [Candidatus Accumulibacter sp.]|jgi:hypothetical protein|nr:FHA domain-containing protein [Accumulibacter sp.]